jgi:hypothetical protein
LPRTEAPPGQGVATLRVNDLRRFLRNPAEANLKRHLHLSAEEPEEAGDFEPLVTGPLAAAILCRQVLERLVIRAGAGELASALDDWPRGFAQRYDDLRLRCRAPEAEFAEIDQEHLRRQLHDRIHGSGGLADFLAERVGKTFCGPILVGENITPLGPRLHLPALLLDLPAGSAAAQVRITGHQTLAWCDAQSFEVLLVNSAKETEAKNAGHLGPQHLAPLLFYLVLLASRQPDRSGRSGRMLVEGKSAALHIASREAIETFPITPGLIAAAEAEEWLGQIAAECLLPTCCDHLPFDAIAPDRRLRAAYEAPTESPPADYPE